MPAIALMALVGGMTQGHPKRRLALVVAAVLCVLWVTFLAATRLLSS